MKLLIACEKSGITKEYFAKYTDFEITSCDVFDAAPNANLGERHAKTHRACNVRDILNEGFDMMIAYPPPGDHDLLMTLVNARIERIAIENPATMLERIPRGLGHIQVLSPFMFNVGHLNASALWLKNVDPLIAVEVKKPRDKILKVARQPATLDTDKRFAKVIAMQWAKYGIDNKVKQNVE